jgi:hypothetical protein
MNTPLIEPSPLALRIARALWPDGAPHVTYCFNEPKSREAAMEADRIVLARRIETVIAGEPGHVDPRDERIKRMSDALKVLLLAEFGNLDHPQISQSRMWENARLALQAFAVEHDPVDPRDIEIQRLRGGLVELEKELQLQQRIEFGEPRCGRSETFGELSATVAALLNPPKEGSQ